MTAFLRRPAVSATALFVALAAGPALAEVTAQQVWDDWRAQMAVYGQDGVTVGSETYENGVLTVTDLGFNITGEDGSTATGTLAELVLTENGDGTVSVTMSEEYPIRRRARKRPKWRWRCARPAWTSLSRASPGP
jgi:hypothetical protein